MGMYDGVSGQVLKDFLIDEMSFFDSLTLIENIEKNIGCVDGKIIGTGRADYTQGSTMYNLNIADKTFSLIDIPGIEGDESSYEEVIRQSLEKAHTIFYVNGSGKKIEKTTLEKIQKYMRDGTSVYALFNVHCKAKKTRIEGIDKSFSEELQNEYEKEKEIINQTEDELKSFLCGNFKRSMMLNGLLSFCSLAFDELGRTSIVDEEDKNLRKDQSKYVNEYSNDVKKMFAESRIQLVEDVINEKIAFFDDIIYAENVKKLKKRLEDMINKIEEEKKEINIRTKRQKENYDIFLKKCYNAKEDCIQAILHAGETAVCDSFTDLADELFKKIEKDKGKTNAEDIKIFFDERKEEIIANIQTQINQQLRKAQKEYQEVIKDAQDILVKDTKIELKNLEVTLTTNGIMLDSLFKNELKYNINDFGGHLWGIGELAVDGAIVGKLIFPGIGMAVGAAVGTIFGVANSVWNYLSSESSRINRAKQKLKKTIDAQIDKVSKDRVSKIKNLNYDEEINTSFEQISECVNRRKDELNKIDKLLKDVLYELKVKYKELA